jgi:hypothetical protein
MFNCICSVHKDFFVLADVCQAYTFKAKLHVIHYMNMNVMLKKTVPLCHAGAKVERKYRPYSFLLDLWSRWE